MKDDDDIQDYVRPWKGLTEEERKEIWNVGKERPSLACSFDSNNPRRRN